MKLVCESWSTDGCINILIYTDDHKLHRYEYMVDAVFIAGWRKRMRYQPGIVLNEIKEKATSTKKLY
jgi:hypothetical protein